ncbi:MAG: CoA-binding protein [Calditrichaeota bacterium]|nr:CoA-binding protein [Calditrichota bacterium]MCB9067915.1 CoA-binding protein [Calditrichia bacterium]
MVIMKKVNENIDFVLREYRTIAVVGLSPNPDRASNSVAKKMQRKGYKVIPVNPGQDEILGEKCYPSLLDIPEKVDLVNVFRPAEVTEPIAEQAVQIGAKGLWLQLGIINDKAAQIALAGGLDVVMDRCWSIEFNFLKEEEPKLQ